MSVKDTLFDELKRYCKQHPEGISAFDFSMRLSMRRNLVSHYLNELVREGLVSKSEGRPVYFSLALNKGKQPDKEVLPNEETPRPQQDVFSRFIGYDGSMKANIEQCRSAVAYPAYGLPILLHGRSGVGKSFLAELIYLYAKEIGVIAQTAPFITLNCADYANNPELLSALLFGHSKGAFTGADTSLEGLVARADQGYLFLDEVHRLNSECQEKLFLLMDKGEYRRIGETKEIRHASIRLIFATTEDPTEVLIPTLRRRIPMLVHISSLQKRPIKEKLELLQHFFSRECQILKRDITVSAQAVNLLLSLKTEGNIGSLQNIIRYSCASAYQKSSDKLKNIYVDIHSFPAEQLQRMELCEYLKQDLHISGNRKNNELSFLLQQRPMLEVLKVFQAHYQKSLRRLDSIAEVQKALYHVFEALHEQEEHPLMEQLIFTVTERFEKSYGVHLSMNMAKIFASVIEAYQGAHFTEDEEFQSMLKQLEEHHFKIYALTEKLLERLQQALGIRFPPSLRFYIVLFMLINNYNGRAAHYNALIMAHGASTASSIAAVANQTLDEFVFESFDMPIDTSFAMFSAILKDYLQRINKKYPTIILVDMGSLLNIDEQMEVAEYQEIGIIDHVSTSIALEVGNLLLQGERLPNVLKKVCAQVRLQYRYIQPKKRKKAVVCVCISGLGTAEKIRDILKEFVQEETELLTFDYMQLITKGRSCDIFRTYDVQCVVGTSDIQVEGIESININHLIDRTYQKEIDLFMKRVMGKHTSADLEQVQQKLIKSFSLESLLNRLVFINPKMVIDDVETVIFDTELSLHTKFDTDVKMMLFLHIAVLIERALLKSCEEESYCDKAWITAHKSQTELIKQAFYPLEKKFNIEIPEGEILSILAMIEHRIV